MCTNCRLITHNIDKILLLYNDQSMMVGPIPVAESNARGVVYYQPFRFIRGQALVRSLMSFLYQLTSVPDQSQE